jgi:multicomponent Na+:H+ antiporter subunit E
VRPTLLGIIGTTCWCLLAWVLLTWTATIEVLATGLLVSALCALAVTRLGSLPPPWCVLRPSVAIPLARLAGSLSVRTVRANLGMAARVWSGRPPPRTGMVVVPTRVHDAGRLGAVGLLTSLVVDNQVVDVDPSSGEMLYHCLEVPEGDRYDAVNGPLEQRVLDVGGRA